MTHKMASASVTLFLGVSIGLLWTVVHCQIGVQWTRKVIGELIPSSSQLQPVRFDVTSNYNYVNSSDSDNAGNTGNTVCLFDALRLQWSIAPDNHLAPENLMLGVVYQRNSPQLPLETEVMLTPLLTTAAIPSLLSGSSVIKCELDPDHCHAAVKDIIANTENKKITVVFQRETNQPVLETREALVRALDIQPPLMGGVIGAWLSPTQLDISVDERYLDHLLKYYQSGRVVSVTVRKNPESVTRNGTIKLHLKEHGVAEIFAVNAATMQIVSRFHVLNVIHCSDSVLVDAGDSMSAKPLTTADDKLIGGPAKPLLRIKGITALSGESGITIPNSNFEPVANGTWSLSMWINLLDPPPASQYRCLFFKGHDGASVQRTPSAWLTPGKNRLSIRASAGDEPNMGSESFLDIAQNQWVFLTFTFLNLSATSTSNNSEVMGDETGGEKSSVLSIHTEGELRSTEVPAGDRIALLRRKYKISDGFKYVISNYVNANTDIVMSFPMSVRGNQAPLVLFKALELGPRAFVKDIVLWSTALTKEEVRTLYLAGPGDISSIDAATMLLSRAPTVLDNDRCYYHQLANSDGALRGKMPTLFRQQPWLHGSPLRVLIPPLAEKEIHTEDHDDRSQQALLEKLQMDNGSNNQNYDPFTERIKLGGSLLQRAVESLQNCEPYADRMDLYAEAARNGNVEALYYWTMMTGFGSETSDNPCGINNLKRSKVSDDKIFSSYHVHDVDALRLAFALIYCAELGYYKALVPLAVILQSGVGMQALLLYSDPALAELVDIIYDSIPLPFYVFVDDNRNPNWNNQNFTASKVLRSFLHEYLASEATKSMTSVREPQPGTTGDINLSGMSSRAQNLSPVGLSTIDVFSRLARGGLNGTNIFSTAHYGDNISSSITEIATGFLHLAATYEVVDSFQALAYRYQYGINVVKDDDTAVFYAYRASTIAHDMFHKKGGQPLAQEDRINDKTEQNINKGNQGAEDEIIQATIVQADEGHVPSMISAADAYYFGSRGLARDQQRALHYYNEAARGGDTYGMCGAAAMYLKGEGGEQNTTRAIEIYEKAAALGSNKALNGLGYIYFFGQTVPKNETKGFEYFLQAALTETDGDALSNAAYCMQHGMGTHVDLERAARFYLNAAQKFGHFDSVRNIGIMYMEGTGVQRSASQSIYLLSVANHIGPWIGWIRRGLDQFLSGNYQKSLLCYVYAGDLGFEIAQSNAAFVIRRKLKLPTMNDVPVLISSGHQLLPSSESGGCIGNHDNGGATCSSALNQSAVLAFSTRSLHQSYQILQYRELLLSSALHNKDSDFLLGHLFFTGAADVFPGSSPDFQTALWWYSKASNSGYSLASLYVGAMNHFAVGLKEKNLPRAARYYKNALEDTNMEYQLRFVAKSLLYMAEYGQGFTLIDMSSTLMEILVKKIYRLEQ